ncbi:hypothetical protein M0208_13505 [Sphingomonas sp. SUN019]|uniref:hypothetical protein n=1 Tax=Sphingomonas sp. SUN019 TaxID=2937788 RepID=UPI002164BBAF|nr:hypothetical protein [Sphingomonas sp. SUN019]UVO51469.1 hypothetical protein M0208_13505 [Sphingomonas sp. SUN019]
MEAQPTVSSFVEPSAGSAARRRGVVARLIETQRKRIAGLRDVPARTALRAANTAPLRRILGAKYQAAIERHRANLPTLTGIDAQIVSALLRDGVFITSLEALSLPGSAGIVDLADAMADDFAAEARRRVRAGIDFNVVPPGPLVATPEVFRWGLHDRLLDIAEAYLELPVAYDGVSINYTVADGREVSTRKWHRDWEDRKMLKIAVYLNDVDDQGGPLQVVGRHHIAQDDANGYRYELASDEELGAVLGEGFRKDIVSCEGPKGTVVFTDTARYFHRGKPAVTRDRKALFYSYFARTPRHPFFCERSGLSRSDIATLSQGMMPRQRAVTAWRTTLPWLLQLIPPAQL